MSFTISQIKNNLTGMSHSGTLNKVRNVNELFERVASKFLLRCHILEGIRNQALTNTIHDDVYNYSLPSDFGVLIDLIPQDNRNTWDIAYRKQAGRFDIDKAIRDKTVSIEGSEGSKIIRINWRSNSPKTLHNMNSVDSNGTWGATGTTANIEADTIVKKSGGASIRFDLTATGDGIQNNDMTAIDLDDEDEIADAFVWFYIKDSTDLGNLTSVSCLWGNTLTTQYWSGVAQTTQADGADFKVGWNQIKKPWSTATETGTVDPKKIDTFKMTFAITDAISDIRVDNIVFSIGRAFDLKYYSKYLFQNSSGTWISKPTSDDDYVMIDNDSLPQFLYECLKEVAHQMEGSDSAFDISYAEAELKKLYPAYQGINPSQAKKVIQSYGSRRRFRR